MYKFSLCFLLLISIANSKEINFNEALDLTLKNNKDLKNQKLDLDISKLNIKTIDSYKLGQVNLSSQISSTNHAGHVFNSKLSSREASFKDFGFSQMNEGINTEPNDLNNPDNRINITNKISYNVPLFTGYKLETQKDILNLQKKVYEQKLKLSKKQLAFEVLKAYNSAVAAKEFIKAVKKAKEAIRYVVKSANAFHKEGLVTKIDVKQAKVYELNTNSKLIEAQNRFSLALAYLKFLTSTNITDVKNLETIYCPLLEKEKLYELALENRDELKMQSHKKDIMKKNIKLSDSSNYPNIYTHLEYGFNDNNPTLNPDKDYYMAMLGLNYNLFDKNKNINKQKSQIQYHKSSIELEKFKDALKLEIEKALLNLKAKEKILKEKYEAKKLAYEVFKQSELMYKNQLIAMTNLLEQEANLRKNEAELIVAKYEKSLAKASLALALGLNFSQNENIKGINK